MGSSEHALPAEPQSAAASLPLAALPLYATALTDTFGGAVQGAFPAALLLRSLLIVVFLVWALQGRGVKADFRRMITASLLYFCVFFFLHFLIDLNTAAVSLEASATLRLLYAPLLACYAAACLTTGRLLAEDARRVILAYGWLILFSLLLGQWVRDASSGIREFRCSLLDTPGMDLAQPWLDRYELEPYLLGKALQLGLRVVEVPMDVTYPDGPRQSYTRMRPIIDWWRLSRPLLILGAERAGIGK